MNQAPAITPAWLSYEAAVQYTSLSKSTLEKAVRGGKIDSRLVSTTPGTGGVRLIRRASLDEWIERAGAEASPGELETLTFQLPRQEIRLLRELCEAADVDFDEYTGGWLDLLMDKARETLESTAKHSTGFLEDIETGYDLTNPDQSRSNVLAVVDRWREAEDARTV